MVRPLVSMLAALALTRVAAADPAVTPIATPIATPTAAPIAAPSPDPAAPSPDPAAPSAEPIEQGAGPARKADHTTTRIMRGPFQTSRLFAMPTADVIGAFMLSISGDGSLLQETGLLTSAGVLALGFGDLAQLEYRHSAAISVTGVNAPLPGVGVQVKIPIPEYPNVPVFGVAFRLGVPRTETFSGTDVIEQVTDLYIVGRWRFSAFDWLTLHGGTRISSAKITLTGAQEASAVKKTLYLPAAGYDIRMNPSARIVGEVALAPQFRWTPGSDVAPTIGYGLLGRLGMRWAIIPSVIIDGSIGYQLEVANAAPATGPDAVVQWDIRLGAEVFVPWGALACRAAGVFCD